MSGAHGGARVAETDREGVYCVCVCVWRGCIPHYSRQHHKHRSTAVHNTHSHTHTHTHTRAYTGRHRVPGEAVRLHAGRGARHDYRCVCVCVCVRAHSLLPRLYYCLWVWCWGGGGASAFLGTNRGARRDPGGAAGQCWDAVLFLQCFIFCSVPAGPAGCVFRRCVCTILRTGLPSARFLSLAPRPTSLFSSLQAAPSTLPLSQFP